MGLSLDTFNEVQSSTRCQHQDGLQLEKALAVPQNSCSLQKDVRCCLRVSGQNTQPSPAQPRCLCLAILGLLPLPLCPTRRLADAASWLELTLQRVAAQVEEGSPWAVSWQRRQNRAGGPFVVQMFKTFPSLPHAESDSCQSGSPNTVDTLGRPLQA